MLEAEGGGGGAALRRRRCWRWRRRTKATRGGGRRRHEAEAGGDARWRRRRRRDGARGWGLVWRRRDGCEAVRACVTLLGFSPLGFVVTGLIGLPRFIGPQFGFLD